MPLLVPTAELQTGMRLAWPVKSDGRIMLTANRELSPADISSLRKRFPKMRVSVVDPILDDLTDFEDMSREAEVSESVRGQIAASMAEVQGKFAERATLEDVDFVQVQSEIEHVVKEIELHAGTVALLSNVAKRDDYLSAHAGNVMYLSMMLGSAVRDYVYDERMRQARMKGVDPRSMLDLTPLGLGAMFIDVGMLELSHVWETQGHLSPEDQELVRQHPIAGAQMLPERFSPLARSIVRTHHENYDGSGYPKGIVRERLQVFTRIVRIADAFDAATAGNAYRGALSPARAIWEMTVGPCRRFYDPVLTKVFAGMIQPFPIGAKLRLADGRYAVVVKYNRSNPFSPRVIIAFDRDGNRLPPNQLDGPFSMDERPDVHLARWEDEDLSYVYDETMNVPRLDRPDGFRTLFQSAYP